MPYNKIYPLDVVQVAVSNPVLGTPTGSRVTARSPVRGRLIEAGFTPNSLVASAITLAVSINAFGGGVSSTASAFVQCITSTLGTFASTVLFEGATASVEPPSPAYVNVGDVIQWTASGGNTSAIGGTIYAVIDAG
jgi:hypothetical protein